MQLFVKNSGGKTTSLEADSNNTVHSIKALLKEKEGFEPEERTLLFNGRALEDGATLDECGILNEAVLVLESGSIHRIEVKSLAGKSRLLDVRMSETILDVKAKIQAWDGLPPDQQRLIFDGKQLEDTTLLSECNFQPEKATLYLVPRSKRFKIVAKTLVGKTIPLDVDPTDTILAVKQKIQEIEGVLPSLQRLIYTGKQLEDSGTISSYKIVADTVVHLVISRRMDGGVAAEPQSVPGPCQAAGACGLINLGNTCFMNSTLQALSNTVPLRKYYRSGAFKKDISDAPLSMNGRLATSFAELLKMMWADTHRVLSPSELRRLITEKRPEFGGFQQHDAQEVLTFLLDGLHEDLNRAPYPRPIIEDPTADGRPDKELADEAWNGNLRRNNSKIVEIFQFQVRSEIVFPDAGAKSLKFDPMMYLSLPVPKPPHSVSMTVLPYGYPERPPVKCTFEIAKDRPMRDLEAMVAQAFPPAQQGARARRFAFVTVYNKAVYRLFGERQLVREVRTYDDLWALEAEAEAAAADAELMMATEGSTGASSSTAPPPAADPPSPDRYGFRTVQVRRCAATSSATALGASFVTFTPPQAFVVPAAGSACDVSELRSQVMLFAERLSRVLGAAGHAAPSQVTLTVSQRFASGEGKPLPQEGTFEMLTGEVLSLNFFGFGGSSTSAAGGAVGTAGAIAAGSSGETPITADEPPQLAPPPAPPPPLPETLLPQRDARGAGAPKKAAELEVTLEQCLDAFTRCEELAKEDWVRCEKTGQFERSHKKLDVWSAPECLLVHLKRFGSDLLGGPLEKVETMVRAPMVLDVSPWLLGPRREQRVLYRLYAVVNHTGSLSFGHYTAHGRVGEGSDRQWYHFNDSTVSRADESEVVTKSAYILFYERLSCSEEEAPATSAVEEAAAAVMAPEAPAQAPAAPALASAAADAAREPPAGAAGAKPVAAPEVTPALPGMVEPEA